MCGPDTPKNISVEFERDAALRCWEVVIINHDRTGEEKQGIVLQCSDNGDIRGGFDLVEGVRVYKWTRDT